MKCMTEKTSERPRFVCMLCHSYYPWDPRVRREAECLIDAGYSVDVLCLKKPGEPASDSYNGVSIYRLPIKRHHGSGVLVYLGEYVAFLLIAAIALVFFNSRGGTKSYKYTLCRIFWFLRRFSLNRLAQK